MYLSIDYLKYSK